MNIIIDKPVAKKVDVREIPNGDCFMDDNGLVFMVSFIEGSDENEFTCTDLQDGCTKDIDSFDKVVPLQLSERIRFTFK